MAVKRLAMMVSLFLIAASASAVPYVFGPGQPAKSEEVNENFSSLEARILALETAGGSITTPPTTTPGPTTPTTPDSGECIYPFFENGVLNTGNGSCSPESTDGSPPAFMLVTADDLVLKYIYQGSIDLQDMAFSIQDKDSVPSGIIALLSFGVSSDGEVTPPKNGAQELFKTADCTGQAYVSAYADQVAIFGGGDVEGLRSPIVGIESTEENVVFESTQFNGIGAADYSCRVLSQLVPKAGIAVAYDIARLLNSIKTPLKIVDYVAPAP